MKYLVTGGCGFIGSHLVDALIERGHHVVVLDDLSTGTLDYKPTGVELLVGDVADPHWTRNAMDGVDGCFHLAAVASVERGNLDWLGTHRTNITGTIAVFDAARSLCTNHPVPVVYASSAAVYGDNSIVLSETDMPRPLSAYGADKYGCELHGFIASHVHNVPNIGLRFFNVYGARQDPQSPYSGVITIFANRIKNQQTITINGDGYHTRDFIYVGDVVGALLSAMAHCEGTRGQPAQSEIFNVCTGRGTNIIDLAGILTDVLKAKSIIKFGEPRPGDPRQSIGDPNKAEHTLGFRSQTSLASGLEKTILSAG